MNIIPINNLSNYSILNDTKKPQSFLANNKEDNDQYIKIPRKEYEKDKKLNIFLDILTILFIALTFIGMKK